MTDKNELLPLSLCRRVHFRALKAKPPALNSSKYYSWFKSMNGCIPTFHGALFLSTYVISPSSIRHPYGPRSDC